MAVLLALVLAAMPFEERHRTFVEDEAHFLLTAEERARFEDLETDVLKDRFVDAFWRRWDRERHRERLAACDRLFGARGRWSERGRVFQRLGPPGSRQRFVAAGNRIVPTELWHYTGVEVSFLPDAFYLIFFQRNGAGDYRLWSPVTDGVAALVGAAEPGSVALGPDPGLDRVDPELALAVEALVPGGGEREALSLLENVNAFPRLARIERVLGADVRTAVTTRELDADFATAVVKDDAGVSELHYALDLPPGTSEALHWRSDEGRFVARFALVGRILGEEGAIERERWEDTIEIDVAAGEKESLDETWLSFRGRRLVQPGDARVEVALVNEEAGALLSARLEDGDTLERPRARRGPVRVLERERTEAEEARYRFVRGVALARGGEKARAIDELVRAVELGVDDVRAVLELGRLLYASGRYREALDRLRASSTRYRDEVDVWVLMAGSAAALDEYGDAERFYDRALELVPGDQAIAEARERARSRAR